MNALLLDWLNNYSWREFPDYKGKFVFGNSITYVLIDPITIGCMCTIRLKYFLWLFFCTDVWSKAAFFFNVYFIGQVKTVNNGWSLRAKVLDWNGLFPHHIIFFPKQTGLLKPKSKVNQNVTWTIASSFFCFSCNESIKNDIFFSF